jgi:hypothetical protein
MYTSVFLFVEIGFLTLLRLIYHFCRLLLGHTPSESVALVHLTQVDIAECPDRPHERSKYFLRILRILRENTILREPKTSAR